MAIRRKPGARRVLSSLLALSLTATLTGFAASAENTDPASKPITNVDPSKALYQITLDFGDALSTTSLSDVCYPANPYAYDATVTLTVDGKTHTGKQLNTSVFSSTRTYSFPDLKAIPSSATLSIATDATSFIYLDDAQQYQYKLAETFDDVPDTTSMTLKAEDWAVEGSICRTRTISATADDYGLCSVLILDNLWDSQMSDWAYANRADYTPDVLTDVTAKVSNKITSSVMPIQGVTQFKVPTKWDKTKLAFDKTANVTLDLTGVDRESFNTPYTGTIKLAVPYDGVSANAKYYNLRSDCDMSYVDTLDEGDPSTSEEPGQLDVIDTILEGSGLNITIDSVLNKYNLDFTSADLDLLIKGKVTQGFIDSLGYGKLGEVDTWGTVSALTPDTRLVSVDAGEYSITGSDQLSLKYTGKLTVKENKTNDVTVQVAPKYTLELTSKAGKIDCLFDGAEFKGETKTDFMLDDNVTHYIEDKDSGYTYEIKATDDNPHLKLVLGSEAGAIKNNTPNNEFEDVPNTADNISIMGIVFLGCIVLFVGSFVLVYMLNKKAERRNK